MNLVGNRKRVKIEDIGMYLRLIQMDYLPVDNEELAQLISENFNVDCVTRDIEIYEKLHVDYHETEDYEKLSRMVENGNLEFEIE
jgi:hypothetical protein